MLQFITNSPTPEGTILQAMEVLHCACKWVQVRMKDHKPEVILPVLTEICKVAKQMGATVIIDDHVSLVKASGADGVHLGRNDMDPEEARRLLGPDTIIGYTVNNMDDAEKAAVLPVDYVGVGPLHPTSTKKNLSPVLTDAEAAELVATSKHPAVIIGGVMLTDILPAMQMGASGVAVSSAIINAEDKADVINKFNKEISKYKEDNE